jgi:hypothetical protein
MKSFACGGNTFKPPANHLIPLPLGLANPLPLPPLPKPPLPPLTGKEPRVDGGTLDLEEGAGVTGPDLFGVALIDALSTNDASVDINVISVSVPCRDESVDISCWSRYLCCLLKRLIESATGACTQISYQHLVQLIAPNPKKGSSE